MPKRETVTTRVERNRLLDVLGSIAERSDSRNDTVELHISPETVTVRHRDTRGGRPAVTITAGPVPFATTKRPAKRATLAVDMAPALSWLQAYDGRAVRITEHRPKAGDPTVVLRNDGPERATLTLPLKTRHPKTAQDDTHAAAGAFDDRPDGWAIARTEPLAAAMNALASFGGRMGWAPITVGRAKGRKPARGAHRIELTVRLHRRTAMITVPAEANTLTEPVPVPRAAGAALARLAPTTGDVTRISPGRLGSSGVNAPGFSRIHWPDWMTERELEESRPRDTRRRDADSFSTTIEVKELRTVTDLACLPASRIQTPPEYWSATLDFTRNRIVVQKMGLETRLSPAPPATPAPPGTTPRLSMKNLQDTAGIAAAVGADTLDVIVEPRNRVIEFTTPESSTCFHGIWLESSDRRS
ncbi:MAG: hypothetical protein OXG35_27315 [Acidobacteria bacterium]|nr:hypothetical protein [Acidobacteriota bacterium]